MNLSRLIGPLLVIAAAVGFMFLLIAMKDQPKKKERPPMSAVVQTMPAVKADYDLTIEAMGTVTAAQEITVYPEVIGKVVEMSPKLAPGAIFHRGELILKIDRRDYENAVEQARAAVATAEYNLKLESGKGAVAKREWELFDDNIKSTPEGKALALREPQMENAIASLEAAKSALEKAKTDLERTEIRAPFDAIVLNEAVDLGARLSTQTAVATLAGTRQFRVEVAVPVSRLPFVKINESPEGKHAKARVLFKSGKYDIDREGKVTRLFGNLDTAGRMAKMLVIIDDPIGVHGGTNDPADRIFIGSYVRIEIEGKALKDAVRFPRTALRDGNTVWLMDKDGKLEVREVGVEWSDRDWVYVTNELKGGEKIVTSKIPTPVPGLILRLEKDINGKQEKKALKAEAEEETSKK